YSGLAAGDRQQRGLPAAISSRPDAAGALGVPGVDAESHVARRLMELNRGGAVALSLAAGAGSGGVGAGRRQTGGRSGPGGDDGAERAKVRPTHGDRSRLSR